MTATCSVEHVYGRIALLMKDLFDNDGLPDTKAGELRAALDEYWETTCNGCGKPYCRFLKVTDWIEYLGYTSLADLIERYDYENGIGQIKPRKGVEPLKATWARRPGSYNP